MTDWKAILSILVYGALIVYSVMKFKSKDIIAFGIIFYLLTLFIVSNLLFPVGTFMNERFIYMPSLGFALILASLIVNKLPLFLKKGVNYKNTATVVLVLILLLFTIRTYTRNKVWKDNFTLFTSDVIVSENSVKCNVSAGGDYQEKARQESDTLKKIEYYERSIIHLEKAISIYPKASNGLVLYGNVLSVYKKDYKKAILQYLDVLSFDPYNSIAYSNTIHVLGSIDNAKEFGYKVGVLKRLNSVNPNHAEVNYNLGKLYGQFKGNLDSASWFLERAISLDSENLAAYKDLGIVYSMKGDYAKALDVFSKAEKLDPSDQQIRQNIIITYQIMNQQRK
jgi:hypothetical protein